MGDPYPEEDAQQMLDQLVATARLEIEDIAQAREGWWNASQELADIAEQLRGNSTPSSNRKAAWVGTASEAATAAFDALAEQFELHATAMKDVSESLRCGEAEVARVAQIVQDQIGTKLKPKPKGGLFGTGIGPSVGPDVVELVDDVADGVGAVAKNPMAIVNKGALLAPITPLAALAVAGDNAEKQELSRPQQFEVIREVHNSASQQMFEIGGMVEGTCSGSTNQLAISYDTGGNLSFDDPGAGGHTGSGLSTSASSAKFRASSLGDPRLGPFASPDRGHSTIGDSVPSFDQGVTVDGGLVGSKGGSSTVDLNPAGLDPYAPGGGGGSGGPGGGSGGGGLSGGGAAAAGAGASVAGVGGGLAGALGGAKAAAAGGLGTAPGVLGGSAGAAGAKGNAMSMLGQGMGGGAGGGEKKGGGKRYGDGPELGPRARRRGPRHAVLGAGSRGGGATGDDAVEPEPDDPFFDGS